MLSLAGALLPTFNFATLGWRDLVGAGLSFSDVVRRAPGERNISICMYFLYL